MDDSKSVDKIGYACILDTASGYYLLATKTDKQWHAVGYLTVLAGIREFENIYNEWHDRGYESSMSACMFWMMLRPSIVGIDEAELPELVEEVKIFRVGGFAGWAYGFKLKREPAKKLWDAGEKPQLITPKETPCPIPPPSSEILQIGGS